MASRIGFVGMTHLGLVSAVAAAAKGFPTVAADPDGALIDRLRRGEMPVSEPGLADLLAGNAARVSFTADAKSLNDCDLVYVAPDVPTAEDGTGDVSVVDRLLGWMEPTLTPVAIRVVLSQVQPGFTRARHRAERPLYYQVETLVFGRAVERAMQPERFIIGLPDAGDKLPATWAAFLRAFGCPILPMRFESAELAKISINCCLVASVSVANTLAELAERVGADWSEIAPALKLDRRIGQHAYLTPGLGIAGGNLERDLAAVLRMAGEVGSDAGVIAAFRRNSAHRADWALRTLHASGVTAKADAVLGVLGLAYKENTHSTRNSPALALIRHLALWRLKVHDPVVPASAVAHPAATAAASPLAAAEGVDALLVMTPWPQFRDLAPTALARAMAGRTVIDPYRVLDGAGITAAGLDYFTLGVPPRRAAHHA